MTHVDSEESLAKRDKLAIVSLSAGHFINDAYSNFLGPLLPLLMVKLNLSIAQAGWLGGILVFSSSFTQPLYGYVSDRYLKRFFAVFSPLITALFMSCIGLAPNFLTLACLLAFAGIGIASFHPQSAAMTSSASRNRRGLGMSIFVSSGTIGYALGPIFITYAVELFGLGRSYVVVIPGIVVFLSLYFLLPSLEHSSKRRVGANLRGSLEKHWRALLLLYLLVVIRSAVQICFVNFLPLFLSHRGLSATAAGKLTSLFLFFGAIGGFGGGNLADRFGERNVISFSMLFSTPFLLAFLLTDGTVSYLMLALGGLLLLSTLPVNVVMAQDLIPQSASVVSALMMGFAWGTGGMMVPIIGKIADIAGLERALMLVVLFPAFGFILSLLLPKKRPVKETIPAEIMLE
jgi:MFS transporter, FSR family, fosmidomycin resistance protein